MALSDQLDRLELKNPLGAKYHNSRVFQQKMAARLRKVAMASLEGTLRDRNNQLVEDTPSVTLIRERLREGSAAVTRRAPEASLENFLRDQRGNGAHATDVSLAVLADALDVNIVLCKRVVPNGPISEQALNLASYDAQKSTLYVVGGYGHWDAFVDCEISEQTGRVISGRVAKAVGDGNCGYNAVALALAAATNSINAPRAVADAAKMITPEPWKEKIKKIMSAEPKTRAAAFQNIQKMGDAEASMLREQLIETQKKQLEKWAGIRESHPTIEEPARAMTPEQQKQIESDEMLAFELAAEEVKNNYRCC